MRSTLDAASSGAGCGRVVATRGARGGGAGSGAPATRGRRALLGLATVAFGLLALAPLSEAKVVVNGFGSPIPPSGVGTTPALGGQFEQPRGVAVNNTGNGGVPQGTVYTVETRNRVQRFSAAGTFERAWGQNVFGRDERQLITLNSGANQRDSLGGSFSLTFGGDTATLAIVPPESTGTVFGPSAAEVKSALEALPSIGAGNVEVVSKLGIASGKEELAGGSLLVKFVGALGGTDVPQLTIDISQLSGTPPLSAAVTTLENGFGGTFAGFEICTVASQCKDGDVTGTTANGGQVNNPQGVAVNQANGHVYVTEAGNRRVSEFDADGNFVRAWGADVLIGGVTSFEICTVAANCKQAAAGGGDGGRFAASIGAPVTDSANNVWIPDATNRRIQEFDSAGNFIAAYGYNVDKLGGAGALETCTSTAAGACQAGTSGSAAGQFSSANPTRLALDSAGNVYAIDAGNKRVQKFDPAFTAAANFGAATFPAFTTVAPNQVISTQGGSRLVFAVNNNVTATEAQLLELDPADASVKDTSLVGLKLPEIVGVAEDTVTGNLQTVTTAPLAISPRKVLTLASAPLPDPVLAMDPVTAKTDTTATLSATVDPKGGWVACSFQYSTDQTTWTDVAEPDCGALAANGGAQAVSEAVTGLTPNSHYFARLSVSRPLAGAAAKTTLAKAFDTDGAAPVLSNVGATQVGDTSVRLLGIIDPRNSATSYVFQYGLTPALGSSTAAVDIGTGATPLLVSQAISGLSPDTTYHFKLVATNSVGSAASSGLSFTTRTEPPAPLDDRAYEQVSPADKNFGGVDFSPLPLAVTAPDGEAAGFCTGSGLKTEPAGQLTSACTNYVSRRGPGGWGTKALNPHTCGFPFQGVNSMPTLNLDHAFVSVPLKGEGDCAFPPLAPGAPASGSGFALYRENLLSDPVGFDLLGPVSSPIVSLGGPAIGVGTSDDAGHLVYRSPALQTPDAPAGSVEKIFDWHEGDLQLASKDTVGQPLTTSSFVPEDAINGVSASGDRIFFQNPVNPNLEALGHGCLDGSCEIYLREDATTTDWISQQECTVACPDTAAADIFEYATPSGSKVFFRSGGKLVDADTQGGSDLYLYTHSADPAADKNLTLLSKDNEPADGTAADVRGVLGASDDGDTVYFAANGQLIPGQPTAAGPKIYRWRWNGGSPTLDYLATLLSGATLQGDERLWNGINSRPLIRLVTPDGKYLLVQTQRRLDPIADQDSSRDVYRWGEADGWVCASCQAPGVPSAGASKIDGTDLTGIAIAVNQGLMNRELRIVMSDDGQHVFFTSPDALVAADQNGAVEDVYEWQQGGAVGLVSGGLDQREAMMLGASASGRDVFFITFDKLVGWDVDANTDIYDARIGGGFPEPPATGAPCEGEACRGAASSAPAIAGAGTAAFQGPGNPTQQTTTCPRGKVRRHGKCVKKPSKRKHSKKHAAGKRAKHPQRRASR